MDSFKRTGQGRNIKFNHISLHDQQSSIVIRNILAHTSALHIAHTRKHHRAGKGKTLRELQFYKWKIQLVQVQLPFWYSAFSALSFSTAMQAGTTKLENKHQPCHRQADTYTQPHTYTYQSSQIQECRCQRKARRWNGERLSKRSHNLSFNKHRSTLPTRANTQAA